MEADSLSGSCPQKVFPGHEFLVGIKRESLTKNGIEQESLTIFYLKKTQLNVSFDYLEWRRKKTVIMLNVGTNVH